VLRRLILLRRLLILTRPLLILLRRLLILTRRSVILTALAALVPSGASALPGPATFSRGAVDNSLFMNATDPVRSLWLERVRNLGSTSVRLQAAWALIAPDQPRRGFRASDPSDPQYRWSALDAAVRAAVAHGQTVLLMASEAPTWAEASDMPAGFPYSGIWKPDARAFGQFAHALALRYSGHFRDGSGVRLPRVRYFQAWNEPNLPYYLAPQWARNGNGPWTPVSPGIYRGLLNAFYAGAKSAQPDSAVLAAGTAPYGDPPATGIGRMYPVTFLEGLFCLTPRLGPAACPDPPHLDILDHHPYAAWPTVHARQAGDISVPDLDKIWRVVHAAQRLHRVVPDGPKSLWITEIDWESSPPPSTLASQTQALALSFYELWQQDVSRVFWFEVIDPPLRPDTFAGAGLYNADGSAKPATAAYRFPFVAVSATHHRYVLWGRAPRPGAVAVEKLTRTGWRRVVSLPTTRGGIFYTVHPLGAHLELRAVIGRAASPVWTTG